MQRDPLEFRDTGNFVLEGLRIMNPNGTCLALYYCKNITIKNCILGPSLQDGIYLYDCSNITVINCSFEDNGTGIRVNFGSQIQVLENHFSNPQGDSTGNKGNFVQFAHVTGSGNKINNNVGECVFGMSNPEDLISIYQSNGSPDDPIQVIGNKLRGGGPSPSGGGIMAGDGGGSYITVEDNILVNPGQYGIAISSGTNIKLLNNKVFGRMQYFTNVGIYVWNQYSTECSNNEVRGNSVYFINNNGQSNPKWNAGNCGEILGWDENNWNAILDETILPNELLCSDLVAYYKFDKDFLDESGNNFNGINKGGVSFSNSGKIYSADFDGIDDYLSINSSPVLKPTKHITITAWIKPKNYKGVMGIMKAPDADGFNSGWQILINNNQFNPRIVTTQGGKSLFCGNLKIDEWNFIVLSYNGYEIKGYVNGELRSSVRLSGDIQYHGSEDLEIGNSIDDSSYFRGQIDELKIYRGVFSDSSIANIYKSEKKTFEENAINNNYLKAFPNPFNRAINILAKIETEGEISASVYDIHGRKILDLLNGFYDEGLYQTEWVDNGDIPNGVYLIMIIAGKNIQNLKIVKTDY